jgi:DNA-binding response OmpR family regulator
MAKILIVEDDADLAEMIKTFLQQSRHLVEIIEDGLSAAVCLRTESYDVIILDLGLPGINGLEVLKQYRDRGGTAGILILSGKDQVAEKIQGLDAGADDYLTKPFHKSELDARLRALLRRPAQFKQTVLTVNDLTVDPRTFTVLCGDKPVHLLPREFAVLEHFMRYPNKVFNAESLLERVWKSDSQVTADAVRTTLKRLRKKLEEAGARSLIVTIHGVGYVLREGGV